METSLPGATAQLSRRRAVPGMVVVAGAGLCVASGIAAATTGSPVRLPPTAVGVDAVLGIAFPVLGTFILARGGPPRLARLCLVPALGALAFGADAYAGRPGPPPGAQWAAWVGLWIWAPAVLVPVTLILLVVPDGTLPSRRWHPWYAVAGGLIVAFTIVLAFAPQTRAGFANPAAVAALDRWTVVFPLLLGGLAAMTAACVVALLRRLARAAGTPRLQLAWVAAGGLVFALTTFGNSLLPAPWPGVVQVVGALAFPLAVAVAMLWHQLYETDPVLRRGLAYGLSVLVLAVAFGVALAAGAGSAGAVPTALLAAAAALLYGPLHRLVSRGVDRALYGRRGDPYQVLTALSAAVTSSAGPAETLGLVAEAVRGALRVPYAQVELGPAEAPLLAVAAGPAGPAVREVPLRFQALSLGMLRMAPRRPGEGLDARDERMLAALTTHVGGVLASAHRELELRAARSQLVTAREEERRRLRRDLHDNVGPVLAGLGFTADAAANCLPAQPDRAGDLLAEVRRQADAATDTVRRISRGLRPPDLDHLGLTAALEAAGERCGDLAVAVRVAGPAAGLDAATEVAAYLVAAEALTNAARHAAARHCAVAVDITADAVEVEVTDDGAGLPAGWTPGVGTTSMRERAEELGGWWRMQDTGAGVTVRAHLPRGVA